MRARWAAVTCSGDSRMRPLAASSESTTKNETCSRVKQKKASPAMRSVGVAFIVGVCLTVLWCVVRWLVCWVVRMGERRWDKRSSTG